MSDETSSNSEQDGALDLSSLNFGPAWARDPAESKSLKKFKDRGDRDDRRGGGGGGRGNDRRGGGSRDNRGGGGFRRQKGGRGRYDDDRRPQRQEVEPPEGLSLQLMPAEESLDLLAKRVIDSGQTFSVFDLAKVLLQSRDRFRVTFESAEKPFFRCREDNSIWLTRDEARRHLWRGEWLKKYYDEVQVEGEVPKGSFSAVARCGLSNEILGPPNYHGYQEKLAALHRERFSNMSLDAYKAKVRMEHGEEAVEAWKESMKTVTKWKIAEVKAEEETVDEKKEEKVEAPEAAEEAPVTPEEDPVVKPDEEAPAIDSQKVEEEVPAVEADQPDTAEESGEEKPENDEAAVAEKTEEIEEGEENGEKVELFDDARAVEQHFAAHHFDEVYEETNRAWVIGDILGNLLSPGLLTLLKRSVAEEKRYPAKLMPVVCRQLSGRQVAVFKWKKKLKVGPSRPHAVPTDSPLSDRPRVMIDQITKHSGVALKEFWEVVMPKEVTSEQKHDWLQDFQWLLGEGHIILLSDTTVHLAKKPEAAAQPAKPAPAKKEEAASPEAPEEPAAKEPAAKEPAAKKPADEEE